jgi:hypothetical protein
MLIIITELFIRLKPYLKSCYDSIEEINKTIKRKMIVNIYYILYKR